MAKQDNTTIYTLLGIAVVLAGATIAYVTSKKTAESEKGGGGAGGNQGGGNEGGAGGNQGGAGGAGGLGGCSPAINRSRVTIFPCVIEDWLLSDELNIKTLIQNTSGCDKGYRVILTSNSDILLELCSPIFGKAPFYDYTIVPNNTEAVFDITTNN